MINKGKKWFPEKKTLKNSMSLFGLLSRYIEIDGQPWTNSFYKPTTRSSRKIRLLFVLTLFLSRSNDIWNVGLFTRKYLFFAGNDPSYGSIFAIITRDTQLCWPKSKMFKVAVPILGPFHAILFFSSILCFIWSLKILNDNRFGFFKSFFSIHILLTNLENFFYCFAPHVLKGMT